MNLADPGIRQHEQDDRQGRTYAEALVDTLQEGLLVLDADLNVETANASFYNMFGVDEAETANKRVFDLGNGQWDIPELRRLLEEVLSKDKTVAGFEVTHTFETIGRRVMVLNARRLDHMQLVLTFTDTTETNAAQTALAALNDTLEAKVTARTLDLARSDLRFRRAFEMGPVAAAMTTLDDEHFTDVNDSFLQLTGYCRNEVVGHSAGELGMWSSREDRSKLEVAERAGGFRELQLKITDKAGITRDVSASGELIRTDGHEGWLKMFVDVTDKKRSEEELLRAIDEVMRDTGWFSRSVVEKLANLRARAQDLPSTEIQDLTGRERQVLGKIAQGLSNDQIAETLAISRNTVRNYVANVYGKLGVSSRAEAVVWARERGIVS